MHWTVFLIVLAIGGGLGFLCFSKHGHRVWPHKDDAYGGEIFCLIGITGFTLAMVDGIYLAI